MAAGLKLKLKAGGEALYRQIEQAVREAIASGQLKPGERLPSAVDLARAQRINKLTVVKAFQRLEKAGVVRSAVGRGTFVATPAQGEGAADPANDGADPSPELARSVRRLREGLARNLRELLNVARRPGTINLSGGVPSPDTVPEDLMHKLVAEAMRRNPRRLFEYGPPAGLDELREALAATLVKRGLVVTTDEIVVTNGSQQAIALAAAWAHDEGRAAISETPSYPSGVQSAFMLFGHTPLSVPWENDAPNLKALDALTAGRHSLFYVCPDFHNPTGHTMPAEARRALAELAHRHDILVIDDEIFRDLRFEGAEPPALYSLLPPGRRIMVGSISKSFMPGLRVGFIVADRTTCAELVAYKRYMDLACPSLVQAVGAALLRGPYSQHLERLRPYYRERRDAALEALQRFMPRGVKWTRPQGGFQMWVTMPQGTSSIQLLLKAIEHGVAIVPGPSHDLDGRFLNSFRLGYGAEPPDRIRTGIERLATIIQTLSAGASPNGAGAGPGILV
jgi:2-aminoadipate transaminase